MLFRILSLTGGNIVAALITFGVIAIALIASISIHEFSHAFASLKLGDPTAKSLGRVTLNPKAHLDPIGTAMLLLFGFGWGRPVPFDPSFLKNPKRDSAIIAFAGPLSNILLASLLAIIYHLFNLSGFLGSLVEMTAFYNLILGFFNLLPVHPLDGFKVVNGFLPESLSYQWLQMAPYGLFILILLIVTNATDLFVTPLLNFSMGVLGL
jgi:Zn-dependent protease